MDSRLRLNWGVLLGCVAAIAFASCGGGAERDDGGSDDPLTDGLSEAPVKDPEDTAEPGDGREQGNGQESEDPFAEGLTGSLTLATGNGLAQAAPVEIQVAPPTVSSGNALSLVNGSLQIGEGVAALTGAGVDEELPETYLGKVIRSFERIRAGQETACTPLFERELPAQPACYNVSVTTDGAGDTVTSEFIEFASTVQAGQLGSEPEDGSGLRVLDDASGVIASLEAMDEQTSPCLVAVSEFYAKRSAAMMDRAVEMVTGMLCAARRAERDVLPHAGETLDLKEEVLTHWVSSSVTVRDWSEDSAPPGAGGMRVAVAQMSAAAVGDDVAYTSVVSLVRTDSNNDDFRTVVDYQNIPGESDGESRGRVFLYEESRQNGVTVPSLISIRFLRTAGNISFDIKEARLSFGIEPGTVLTDEGELSYPALRALENNIASPARSLLSIDPQTGLGTVVFGVSPSLDGGEVTSVVAVESIAREEGGVEGCGIAGHTLSFVDNEGLLRPDLDIRGKHCLKNQNTDNGNFGNDLSESQFESFAYVQRQCFAKQVSASWSVVSENLSWVVDDACGADNPDFAEHFDLVTLSEGLAEVTLPTPPVVEGLTRDSEIDYLLDFVPIP